MGCCHTAAAHCNSAAPPEHAGEEVPGVSCSAPKSTPTHRQWEMLSLLLRIKAHTMHYVTRHCTHEPLTHDCAQGPLHTGRIAHRDDCTQKPLTNNCTKGPLHTGRITHTDICKQGGLYIEGAHLFTPHKTARHGERAGHCNRP